MTRHTTTIGMLFFTALLSAASPAHAADPFKGGLEDVARKILAVMAQNRAETVTVLGVEDGTTLGATVTGGIEIILKDELKKSGRLRDSRGAIGVKGKLLAPKNDAFFERQLRIEFKLTDAFGDEVTSLDGEYLIPQKDQSVVDENSVMGKDGKLKQRVDVKKQAIGQGFTDPSALLIAFGGNGQHQGLGGDGLGQWRSNEDLIKTPESHISGGTMAKTSPQSPFGVRIVSEGRAKPLTLVDGQPFVQLEQGEKFTVDIENAALHPLAATITIDGLNTFYFSQTAKDHAQNVWMLPSARTPGKPTTLHLEGWYVRRGEADKFVATSYEASKRKEAKLAETPIGAVTVLLQHALPRVAERTDFVEVEVTREVPREGGGTAQVVTKEKKGLMMAKPSMAADPLYIGGAGKVKQIEGDPSKLVAGVEIGVITIRYRHPSQ